jgi:ATP-dependent Lon protease
MKNIKLFINQGVGEEFMPILSVDNDLNESNESFDGALPLLALKNTVLFPGIVIPITIGREKSVKAVKVADSNDKYIVVVSQREQKTQDPTFDDLYDIGVVAKIVKMITMPDGSSTAILQGRQKIRIVKHIQEEPYFAVEVEKIEVETSSENSGEFEAIISAIKDTAKKIIELSPQIPSEALMMLQNIKKNEFLLNFLASNLNALANVKQEILQITDLEKTAEAVLIHLNNDLRILELKAKIENKVKGDIEKQQRDYFLNQQMRTIQEELGGNPQEEEINALEEKASKLKWPESAKKQFEREITKVRRINPQVAEYSVTMNYLELLTELPWEKYSKDNFDLKKVRKILDKDHFGLEDIKDRIIEHLAVLKLKGDLKAPILCLVGPPGVGKTSLGKSIADALGRTFIRMSLGGLHDESELRGHRKTYIGAMPGRVIQSLKKAGTSNPVFILDEIDKLGRDHRGDPSSALLEILDPEQNNSFHDNYLDTEYDLSKILFIATANSLNTIQPALRDRMEIIQLSGYSTEEKISIAKKHLVPKQRKQHGLKASDVAVNNKTLLKITESYTRESGVRGLDRNIAGVMRYVAKKIAMDESYDKVIKAQNLKAILGPEKFNNNRYTKIETNGVAVGLAWTSLGGDILFIESNSSPGKGKLTLTGNLGDVMKESATTALSYIKANAKTLNISPEYFDNHDFHIHVPEGAIPKDGPSAGITMLTSLASTILGKATKPFTAMTGEITLRGKVLPVGGIKEKILAAKRSGIKNIVLSEENKKHVEEIEQSYINDINFIYVEKMEQVLKYNLNI